jgi:hypothetical protein
MPVLVGNSNSNITEEMTENAGRRLAVTLHSATEGAGLLIGAGPRPNLAAHQTALLEHFQAWILYGLVVPDVDNPAGMTAATRPPRRADCP